MSIAMDLELEFDLEVCRREGHAGEEPAFLRWTVSCETDVAVAACVSEVCAGCRAKVDGA